MLLVCLGLPGGYHSLGPGFRKLCVHVSHLGPCGDVGSAPVGLAWPAFFLTRAQMILQLYSLDHSLTSKDPEQRVDRLGCTCFHQTQPLHHLFLRIVFLARGHACSFTCSLRLLSHARQGSCGSQTFTVWLFAGEPLPTPDGEF